MAARDSEIHAVISFNDSLLQRFTYFLHHQVTGTTHTVVRAIPALFTVALIVACTRRLPRSSRKYPMQSMLPTYLYFGLYRAQTDPETSHNIMHQLAWLALHYDASANRTSSKQ